MYDCGIFDKSLDEWEDLAINRQTWDEFHTHVQNAEEKCNLKIRLMTKWVALEVLMC